MPINKSIDTIVFEPMVWPHLTKEHGIGMLIHDSACYALWYYYGVGYNVYLSRIKDKLLLEGEAEPITNHKQLFNSVATMYGVQPEQMIRFWLAVDNECDRQKLPILKEPYRFDTPLLITSS